MSTASAMTSHQNHPQQSSGSNSTTNVSHNKTPKVFLQTLGVLFVTTYAVLEISIAQCHHQDAHVVIELLIVEHTSHLMCVLSDSATDSESLARTL